MLKNLKYTIKENSWKYVYIAPFNLIVVVVLLTYDKLHKILTGNDEHGGI